MKRLIILLLTLLVGAGLYGVYLFNKKPADTHDEKADFEISSIDLMKEFSLDEDKATKKYGDKILSISGKISEINQASVTVFLDASDPIASVTCSFYANELPHIQSLKKGDMVQIKGKCTGKLTDVVLNNCVLSRPNN